jgi:DNA-binding GntR family transcriptional regulator
MEKRNLKETVYDEILKDIYSGNYAANEIITETKLMQKYGFSKAPVRESLTALCQEGILKNIPRCGYQVVALTARDIQEIMEYRSILETTMLRRSMDKCTDVFLTELEEIAKLCNRGTENPLEHWTYNVNFHLTLLSLAGNTYAMEQLRSAMNTLWRGYVQIHGSNWSTRLINDMKYHFNITQALRDRDLESAIRYLKLDLNDFGTTTATTP